MKVYWFVLDALPMGILKGAGGEVSSPSWDEFLAGAVCYENAYAQATWTYPSFASFLTGRNPHQAFENLIGTASHENTFGYFGRRVPSLRRDSVDIVRRLALHGYRTKVFSNPIMGNEYDYSPWNLTSLEEDIIPGREYGDILKWIFDHRNHGNTFILYRSIATHFPFANPKYFPLDRIKRALMGQDHGEMNPISFAGPMEERLRNEGPAEMVQDLKNSTHDFLEDFWPALWNIIKRNKERSLVIFSADHGSDLNPPEKGKFFHAGPVTSTVARVPLIIGYPVSRAQSLTKTARLIDIVPTILEVCNMPAPTEIDGRSLRSINSTPAARPAVCFSDWQGGEYGIFDNGLLAVHHFQDNSKTLYRYSGKPILLGQDEPLAPEQHAEQFQNLLSRLAETITGNPFPDALDTYKYQTDMTERLKALGYI